MNMGKYVFKNYPSPRLMETIGATNQSVPEAIGELIANSFDARIDDNKVNITVDLSDGEIKVIDNGKGMTIDVLEKAVCIAEDMSKHISRSSDAKGHFGMGFKTSCSTLGKYYEIFTKPLSGDEEFHVEFNIDDYSRRPSGADAWDVEIESSKKFAKSPLKKMEHGTAFVIKNLRDNNVFPGAVYDYLGDAFKGHLETGDKITLLSDGTDTNIIPRQYDFIPNTKINIDEKFDVEVDGIDVPCEIKGWVALDKQTHNDGLYGFNIYRNNQLLEKWNKEWFSNHLMTSRIRGEVEMDFLESTFYKQGTQQSEKWKVASEHMKEFLKGIVKASRDISRKGNINKPSEVRRIVNTLNEEYGTDYKEPDNVEDRPSKMPTGTADHVEKHVTDKIKGYIKEDSLELEDYGLIEISYFEKDGNANVDYPFDYIFEEKYDENDTNAELQVIVINDHPLWSEKIDSSIKRTLVTSDAIYRMLVEQLHMDSANAFKIRNEWINERTKTK